MLETCEQGISKLKTEGFNKKQKNASGKWRDDSLKQGISFNQGGDN